MGVYGCMLGAELRGGGGARALTIAYLILLVEFGELPQESYYHKFTLGFHQRLAHLSPSWLVSKTISLSRHMVKQGFNT